MLHFASKAEIRFRSETKRRNSGRRLHSTGMFVLAALVKLQRFTQRLFERRANVLYRIEVSDIEMFNDVLNNFKKKSLASLSATISSGTLRCDDLSLLDGLADII